MGYDKALVLEPAYAQAFYNRGNVLYELTRFGEALASYDKALEISLNSSATLSATGAWCSRS